MTITSKPSRFWRTVFLPILGLVLGALCAGGCDTPKNQPSHNVTMDVSPDGKSLLFTGEGKHGADIFLLNLTTGAVRQLTDTDTQELTPKFSADGKRIVFSRGKPGFDTTQYIYDRRIFVMELAPKKKRRSPLRPPICPQAKCATIFNPRFPPTVDSWFSTAQRQTMEARSVTSATCFVSRLRRGASRN